MKVIDVRVWSTKLSWVHGVGAVLIAVAVFVFSFLPLHLGPWAAGTAVVAGVAYYLLSMRRYFRRRRLTREPFPASWRQRLESCVAFYRKLDDAGRRRFETDVQIFMAEHRVYGIRGAETPDEAKLLVAASAAMLGHGMPDWEWPTVRDVVIYPAAFDDEYDLDEGGPHGELFSGMVHHQGPIIFSGPELTHGFCTDRDGYNVGLHEMAHVMDFADGQADGVPAGAEWVATAPWIGVVADRLQRVRRGELRRVVRDYGGKNEAEFFAVAVETFFERPDQLAAKDAELFDMLADYFNVDPRTGALRRPVA